MCPGILKQPGAATKLLKNFHSYSGLGDQIFKLSIEGNPKLCTHRAVANAGTHFPAGGSFK